MKTFILLLCAVVSLLNFTSCTGNSGSLETWDVTVELLEMTPIPGPEEIKPYEDALVAFRYRLKEAAPVDKDTPPFLADELIILHWAIREKSPVTALKYLKAGDERKLRIQRFADRPDLKGRYIKNGLDSFDLLLFAEAEE